MPDLSSLLPESIGTRKTFLNVFERSAIEFRFVTTTKDLANPAYHKERGTNPLVGALQVQGLT